MEMERRTVVITGVTRGLGRAMAEGFAAGGHRVGGCGRTGELIESLAERLGSGHVLRRVDVRGDGVGAWAEEVLEVLGPPDLLINNAGVINRPAPLWSVPGQEFEALVGVNLVGVYRVIRALVPAMVERGSGVVVNMSSGWGRTTSPEVAPYCASKWGIEGLTKALAQELPPGMAAVALSPGVVNTDMLQTAWGATAASHPTPARWAETAVPFLLSLGPRHNGQSLSTP